MTDEITKNELQMMIEVQSKSAQQMESIANSLHRIVEKQESIASHLGSCNVCKESVKVMSKDISLLKWMWTSLAALVGFGMLIIQILEKFH